MSIVYTKMLERMKQAGITSYTFKQSGEIGQKTLTAIKEGRPINTKTIDALCRILNCQPGDLLEYVADSEETLENAEETTD